MMQSIRSSMMGACALSLALATAANGQMAAKASDAPSSGAGRVAIRQLGAPVATSTEALGSLAAVRQLPNGNVLVNDPARRRVLLMDPQLNIVSVVADSTSNTANAYGGSSGGLIAYRGDSTLFVDPASLSMLVIDPSGKIVRTIAAPRPSDVMSLTGGIFGTPGFDSQGRLIYRSMSFGRFQRPQPGQPFTPPTPPDSAALVRFDLATRKLDTLGFFKIPKPNMSVSQDANGGMRMQITMNPLPIVDEWAVMSDGSVALVRGRDYHVEFIAADGAKTVADKIPYDWQRMTDDDKQRFLDSAKVAIEKQRAALTASGGVAGAAARGGIEGALGAMAGGATIVMRGDGPGGGPPRLDMGGGGPGGGSQPVVMVPVSELPDYKPVFGPGAVRADMDGHLWVRTIPTKVLTGGAIYEVIDRSGKLVDRVQVPTGTTIAGFGQGSVVYLGMRDDKGLHIQRAVVK